MLTINETITSALNQPPRWNYKKANQNKFQVGTDELTKDIRTEGKNTNNVVKIFNASILKAAKESIPRGVRKDYKPYWCDEIKKTHDTLTRAREEAEANPSQENNTKLQYTKAKNLRTKLQCQRQGLREKTSSLNMEKDTKKLWNLTKALNDEGSKGNKITLEDEGITITGKAAANVFAKGYEAESNINIPLSRKEEVRQDERDSSKTAAQDIVQRDITMPELRKSINMLKNKKILLNIFNLSWSQGQVPQIWKEAIMMPILMKGKTGQEFRVIAP